MHLIKLLTLPRPQDLSLLFLILGPLKLLSRVTMNQQLTQGKYQFHSFLFFWISADIGQSSQPSALHLKGYILSILSIILICTILKALQPFLQPYYLNSILFQRKIGIWIGGLSYGGIVIEAVFQAKSTTNCTETLLLGLILIKPLHSCSSGYVVTRFIVSLKK